MQFQHYTTNARRLRTQIVRSNPQKSDPTRTKTLRKRFEREISIRASRLAGLIVDLIVEEDAFGLKQAANQEQSNADYERRNEGLLDGRNNRRNGVRNNKPGVVSAIHNQRFTFQTAPDQLASFEAWLREQQGPVRGVRFGDRADPYWEEFIQEGYAKGAGRAWDDTNRARRALATTTEDIEFLAGSKEQFLRDAFAQPETREKISLLASRTFGDLRAVDGQMAALLNRTLAAGLAQGMNPRVIARTMLEGIGLNRDRAQVIARTEIIRAHAEGQLDAMERMGVEKVGVMVEWSSAGDDRVCALCQPLDGVVMKISEARGLIPRHPNCRCAHVPAQVGEPADTTRRVNYGESPRLIGQRKTKAEIEAAFRRSVGAERKKGTLKEKFRRSKWQGADRKISKKRPKRTVRP